MARRPKDSPPAYCLRKQSGQAYFNWPLGGGKYKTILLGKHESPDSHKELVDFVIARSAPAREPKK